MEFFSLANTDLKAEIFQRAKNEAIGSREAFVSMVDAVIEDHRRSAELSNDQNLEMKEDVLEAFWNEYQHFIQK